MKGTLRILMLSGLLAIVMLLGRAASFANASAPAAPPPQHKLGHLVVTDSYHAHLDCSAGNPLCTEVMDSIGYSGAYTGHDEPSLLFYSNVRGSGYSNEYRIQLPKDPPKAPAQDGSGGTPNFMLRPAFWFGMIVCDSQSYPNPGMACPADTDANIANNANPASADFIGNHPGAAYMEMQFYPPGWAAWPPGNSCDKSKWCAALNIDSFSEDGKTNNQLNATCQAVVGLEYVNFAFITKSGTPQPNSPPNPVNATVNTYTPDANADLFMNSGDWLTVQMFDTKNGLRINIHDTTSHQNGSMTASAANGFGQVQFDPTGTSCNNMPYDFHPMYSTSSEDTRVPWTAHTYNIAFSDEIGHFQYCNTVNPDGSCADTETNGQTTDADDVGCFPASASTLYPIAGCLGQNTGFDGTTYGMNWPGTYASPTMDRQFHAQPVRFTSPLFIPKGKKAFTTNYQRVGFEADLPRIETGSVPPCNRLTGTGCTNPPINDSGMPALFYPLYTTGHALGDCVWQLGGSLIPGTTNTFGGTSSAEYGPLLPILYYSGGPTTSSRYNDFRQVMNNNPCKVH